MSDEVRDWSGRVVGYECRVCGAVFSTTWDHTCRGCQDKERRHRELIKAIRESGKQENPK